MESTSRKAEALLASCLDGRWRRDLLDSLLAAGGTKELLSIVVEGLSDRFEPRLCDLYAELFGEALARAIPGLDAHELRRRYERIRAPRVCTAEDPARVVVLSRVTLGADAAVTSVLLDAAKRRFPRARIELAGSRKAWELFGADPRIDHLPVAYPRGGTLAERLSGWPALRNALDGALVVDPDSRLTQLGLLPVCSDEHYFFFESRASGGDRDAPLGLLAAEWARAVFGVDGKPFIAPVETPHRTGDAAVSFGVGENPAKRVADPFEAGLLGGVAARGLSLVVDRGAGGEEGERVDRAVAACGGARIQVWDGSFAAFARSIQASRVYVGYDSAGQHAAAAAGVPSVTVFAGYPCERMFQRWRPWSRVPHAVIQVKDEQPETLVAQALEAVDRLAVS
ncbi:MAG: hypothetical protein IPM24_13500 [Bryobacterales bacterium]|nr:hypothetical protein [Bryobacterales bacterium]